MDEIEVRGNHDDNNFNDENDSSNVLTAAEWYGVMLKPLENKYVLDRTTHYVIDNESQKIRYIILDSENSNYNDELSYLEGKLTELTSDWTALIFQHRYWDDINTVSSRGTALQNKINALYSNLNCKFAGVIVGHLHADISINDSTNGYPIIGVCCDTRSAGDSGYDRTANTTNEQCFDVVHIDFTNRKIYMTRIGAGDTVVGSGTGVREFTY